MNRSSRSLVFFTSEKAKNSEKLTEISSSLSVLHKLWQAEERNLYSLLLQQVQKTLIIYIDYESLSFPRFRQCMLTCVAAKLSIIIVKEPDIQNEKVFDYFPYISQGRYARLKTNLTEALILQDVKTTLLQIDERLKKSIQVDPITIYTRKQGISPWKFALENCLQNKKLELVQPKKSNRVFSYNMSRASTRLASSILSKGELRKSPDRAMTSLSLRHNKSQSPNAQNKPSTKDIITKNVNKISFKDKEVQETKSNSVPIIEISDETKALDNVSDTSSSVKNNDCKQKPLDKNDRKFSFEYLAKTYAIFDPTEKKEKNLLYIQFPNEMHLLKNSMKSRRKSFRLSLSSSSTDINLEYALEETFESPIPSPTAPRSFKYRNPLPIFSSDNCFPPIELFPCEKFQRRRPSVFDVILEANK